MHTDRQQKAKVKPNLSVKRSLWLSSKTALLPPPVSSSAVTESPAHTTSRGSSSSTLSVNSSSNTISINHGQQHRQHSCARGPGSGPEDKHNWGRITSRKPRQAARQGETGAICPPQLLLLWRTPPCNCLLLQVLAEKPLDPVDVLETALLVKKESCSAGGSGRGCVVEPVPVSSAGVATLLLLPLLVPHTEDADPTSSCVCLSVCCAAPSSRSQGGGSSHALRVRGIERLVLCNAHCSCSTHSSSWGEAATAVRTCPPITLRAPGHTPMLAGTLTCQ